MDEEEKKEAEPGQVEHWKDLIISQPETLHHVLGEMPKEVAEALVKDPDIHPFISEMIAGTLPDTGEEEGEDPEGGGAGGAEMASRARRQREDKEEQVKKLSLYAQIARLDVGAKAKLARSGDKDVRSILIKDGSKQVSLSVLDNPKITIQEIEMTAASRNVSEDVLRIIGNNNDWTKFYTVMLALVNNPKTPIGVSLTHLGKIHTRDLRFLAKSKGIPEAIKISAKKLAQKRTV